MHDLSQTGRHVQLLDNVLVRLVVSAWQALPESRDESMLRQTQSCPSRREGGMSRKKKDWRSLPRKPAAQLRKPAIGIRLTDAEAAQLRANAVAAELNLTDYIVSRCCQMLRKTIP